MVNMKGAGRGAAVCACAFGKNGLSILLAYIPAFDRRSRPIHWESEHCRLSGKGVDIFPPIQQSNMAHVIAENFDAERFTGRYILKMRHLVAPPQAPFGHRFDRLNGHRYVGRESQVFVVCSWEERRLGT